jgi:putative transcriptional regulator
VIYLAQHGDEGTLGFVVNRRTSFTLGDAVEGIDGPHGDAHRLYLGGPVGLDRVMFLARTTAAPPKAVEVDDGLYLAAERDALESLLTTGASASDLRLYIGYAGWGAGQLAGELRRGDWFQVAGDHDLIFADDPEAVWRRLINKYEPRGRFVGAPTDPLPSTSPPAVEPAIRADLARPVPANPLGAGG